MNIRGTTAALAIPILLVLVACVNPSDTRTGDTEPRLELLDSAGVEILRATESPWLGEPVSLGSPLVRIAGAAEGDSRPLYAVVDAVRLSSGETVVANAGTHEIYWFSRDRQFIRAAGGEGDGPGEFSGPYTLTECEDDRIAVGDFLRVTVLDDTGRLISTRRIIPDDNLRLYRSSSSDCDRVLVGATPSRPPPPQGAVRGLLTTLFWDAPAGVRDTVKAGFAWVEQFGGVFDGLAVALVRPWSPQAVWATNADVVYFGDGRQPQIEGIEPDGSVSSIVQWPATAPRLDPSDNARYSSARSDYLSDKPPYLGEIYADLDVVPLPSHLPEYSGLMVDDRERIWILRYPREAAGRTDIPGWAGYQLSQHWAVFDRKGSDVFSIRLPLRHELLAVEDGVFITLYRDELDREFVTIFADPTLLTSGPETEG